MNAVLSDLSVTVTVGQLAGTDDIEYNLAEIERVTRAASESGAKLVVFPEAVMYPYTEPAEKLAEVAQLHGRQFESAIQAFAVRHKIAIVAGVYLPSQSGRSRNILTLLRPDGSAPTHYDKIHQYDAFGLKESEKHDTVPLKPNYEELVVFDLEGIKFGLLNCYDLRFPEMSRLLIEKGADVLLIASGWVAGPLKALQWETLVRARAIENTCYVAASCQPAPQAVGLSMIVDPMGAVIAGVHEGSGFATGKLTMERQAYVRSILPCVSQRRYMVMHSKNDHVEVEHESC